MHKKFEINSLSQKLQSHFKNKENRSYPLFLTENQIKEELKKLIEDENYNYILDRVDDEIVGICGYYILEEQKYLQTVIFASFNKNKTFIKKVLDYLIEKFPGYRIIIGLEAENSFIVNALREFRFQLTDDLYSSSLKLGEKSYRKFSDINKVSLCQWEKYKEIHEKNFGEGYWDFDRIKEDFDNWSIYSIEEDKCIKSYIFIKNNKNSLNCEIFGIYGDIAIDRLRLIEHSLASIVGKELIYYFLDDYEEMKNCEKFGFEMYGHYQAWKLR